MEGVGFVYGWTLANRTKHVTQRSCRVSMSTEIPLRKGNRILDTLRAARSPDTFMQSVFDQYGPIVRSVSPLKTVMLKGYDAAQFFYVDGAQSGALGAEGAWPPVFKKLLMEDNIAFTDGKRHQRLRQLVSPPFTRQAVTEQAKGMNRIIDDLFDRMLNHKGEICMAKEARWLAFNNTAQLIIGMSDPQEIDMLKEWYEDLQAGLQSFGIDLPGTKFHRAATARNKLRAYILELVKTRRQQIENLKEGDHVPIDSLSLLIRAKDEVGNQMSDEDIVTQIALIIFAGHETITATMTWIVQEYLNPRNRAYMTELRKEVQGLTQTANGVPLKELMSSKLLEMSVKEVYRMYPPAGSAFRRVKMDTKFKDYELKKDEIVVFCISATNLDPDVHSEPTKFNPYRFKDETGFNHATLPTFGNGSKVCIGFRFAHLLAMSFSARFVRLMNEYDVRMVEGQDLRRKPFATTNVAASGVMITIGDARPPTLEAVQEKASLNSS
eukprot:Plantae.Rhodophyta-Purpureofilum_apyrenoidigerum.ctg10290.p1 GENE.Plantae.Rhodophyta-Purpureofilum_apyrenoidigerum.ctg10290~~Plantae.Rhodophyta-Purpureofilum_apyrenoidigerum.ctg10290.p1  ORF type:complete len:514 (-),score=90.06 Plantae.Rhodophyta-Purpureofilum_apyrenoidigerum.ctg10290:231-1715(-)